MEWMILPLKRYAQFSGRSRRKEFWMWVLFIIIVSVVLSLIDGLLGLSPAPRTVTPGQFGATPMPTGPAAFSQFRSGVLTSIFSLAIFLPNLAVQVRRLHDTDRRGWWLLLPVVPYAIGFALIIVGALSSFRSGRPFQQGGIGLMGVGGLFFVIGLICAILVFVWFCMDGTRGPNRFGEDPKRPHDLGEVFR
ncbi:DUF805 domain-containing protein [uncultured Sphingomonas sp.]|uniref:DUF805 domain-containing protein n=1 Tax=uncultured Sphingomonas sp. TaxID=158754 RepID=UPI0035C9E686